MKQILPLAVLILFAVGLAPSAAAVSVESSAVQLCEIYISREGVGCEGPIITIHPTVAATVESTAGIGTPRVGYYCDSEGCHVSIETGPLMTATTPGVVYYCDSEGCHIRIEMETVGVAALLS